MCNSKFHPKLWQRASGGLIAIILFVIIGPDIRQIFNKYSILEEGEE